MRLGVFGGTFDPVHVGHLAIAHAALESVPLDRVLFVLARRAPLKEHGPVAGEADRVAMLELAVAGEPRFSVSRVELDREGPSYTVDTLEALAGTDDMFLILGSDAMAALPRWKDPDRIATLATLVVAERPGAPGRVGGAPAGHFDAPRLDISSRELRARAARGRSLRYLVPDPVWKHIEARGLYRAEGPTSGTT
ncbi:MAG TPA: nicotinate-nucleotide adenylyltransferase [Candidatus Limnocylindria bacterium]|nr:nicotinate-nucleotide adenylyltransferase [Candidatus Limnocylindria bacterium]